MPGAAAERLPTAGVIDDAGVPDAVQIRPAIEPADLEVVPALVVVLADVKRLVEVTDQVDHEP